MAVADCGVPPIPDTWCPASTDDVMPSIYGLLPEGPAFDAVRFAGTMMNKYWRAIGDLLFFVHTLFCAYILEFFCNTATQSLDQWNYEYGIGADPCDPWGANLCAKVTALVDPTCQSFTDIALANGWVITCEAPPNDPIAGCFECGCTPMGPTPTLANQGSNLNFGDLDTCGGMTTVVSHPEPQYWDTTKTSLATCTVPGSNLGQGPDDEGCCFIVGYYTDSTPPIITRTDACVGDEETIIHFDCPTPLIPPLRLEPADSTGNFLEYGHSFVWTIVVDLGASYALQGISPPEENVSNAGNLIAGCTPLCSPTTPPFDLCFLDEVAPAHTLLITEVIQP